MNELLAWLEATALGHAMRETGGYTYGIVNLTHILGISTLFGAVLILDLRLLGLWRSIPLTTISRPTVPVAATGFAIASISGVCLITTNATEYAGNPYLLIKFPAIALALLNVAALNFLPAWKNRASLSPSTSERLQLAAGGAISLGCWLAAISAGRMIGYW